MVFSHTPRIYTLNELFGPTDDNQTNKHMCALHKNAYVYTHMLAHTHTHPVPAVLDVAQASACLFIQKPHSCCQGNGTLNEKGDKHLIMVSHVIFFERQQAAPIADSCWPRSWISRAGPGDRMWHGETRGAGVKVVRTYRRWLTQLHRPLQIMSGFFHR